MAGPGATVSVSRPNISGARGPGAEAPAACAGLTGAPQGHSREGAQRDKRAAGLLMALPGTEGRSRQGGDSVGLAGVGAEERNLVFECDGHRARVLTGGSRASRPRLWGRPLSGTRCGPSELESVRSRSPVVCKNGPPVSLAGNYRLVAFKSHVRSSSSCRSVPCLSSPLPQRMPLSPSSPGPEALRPPPAPRPPGRGAFPSFRH